MPPGRPPVQLMRRHRRNFIRCRTARELDFFSSLSSEIGIRNRSIDREGKVVSGDVRFRTIRPETAASGGDVRAEAMDIADLSRQELAANRQISGLR